MLSGGSDEGPCPGRPDWEATGETTAETEDLRLMVGWPPWPPGSSGTLAPVGERRMGPCAHWPRRLMMTCIGEAPAWLRERPPQEALRAPRVAPHYLGLLASCRPLICSACCGHLFSAAPTACPCSVPRELGSVGVSVPRGTGREQAGSGVRWVQAGAASHQEIWPPLGAPPWQGWGQHLSWVGTTEALSPTPHRALPPRSHSLSKNRGS